MIRFIYIQYLHSRIRWRLRIARWEKWWSAPMDNIRAYLRPTSVSAEKMNAVRQILED